MAANLGTSVDEARARLQRQPYVAALTAQALALYPASYAGFWIDHANDGSLTFAFTSDRGTTTPGSSEDEVAQVPADVDGVAQVPADVVAPIQAGVDDVAPIQAGVDEIAPVQANGDEVAPVQADGDEVAQIQADLIGVNATTLYPSLADATFTGVAAEYTYAELMAAWNSLYWQLEVLRAAGIGVAYVAIDVVANRVDVVVEDSGSAAQLERIYVADTTPVRVRVGDVTSTDLHHSACGSRLTCENPLRGGTGIGYRYHEAGGGETFWYTCTGGFTATNGSSSYLLTAAHCVDRGRIVYSADQRIGGVPNEGVSDIGVFEDPQGNFRYLDVARIFVEPPFEKDHFWTVDNIVYANDALKRYQIRAVADPDTDVVPGLQLCAAGMTSGYECYSVARAYTVHYDEQRGQYRIYALDFSHEDGTCDSRPGDSGGPIFAVNTAFGILSGQVVVEGYGLHCVATHARHAEEELGLRILTN